MRTKVLAFFLAFSLLFIPALPAHAAKNSSSSNRYFVKSTANLWKNSFNARNNFENGFTADLTDWQLRVAKLFNIEVEPVAKLYVSPVASDEAVVSAKVENGKTPSRIQPEEQISWGVATIYDSPELTSPTGGDAVTVAVLDTGVVKSHPDLTRRVADCRDFTTPKGGAAAGKCDDKNGHGTHVAGIIAADGGQDGKGIYGVAPEAKLVAYKVCDQSGSCWADDIALAMHMAVDNDAQIINLSLGSDVDSPLINEAVNYAADHDVLVVAAAGNDGPYTGSIDYPAANPRVVAVGAIDEEFIVPDWSSRGMNLETDLETIDDKDLEFVAPGANIESIWKEGYAVLSGTSMATPFVAGLAAKYWNKDVEHPAQAVRDHLQLSARDIAAEGQDNDSGLGLPLFTK